MEEVIQLRIRIAVLETELSHLKTDKASALAAAQQTIENLTSIILKQSQVLPYYQLSTVSHAPPQRILQVQQPIEADVVTSIQSQSTQTPEDRNIATSEARKVNHDTPSKCLLDLDDSETAIESSETSPSSDLIFRYNDILETKSKLQTHIETQVSRPSKPPLRSGIDDFESLDDLIGPDPCEPTPLPERKRRREIDPGVVARVQRDISQRDILPRPKRSFQRQNDKKRDWEKAGLVDVELEYGDDPDAGTEEKGDEGLGVKVKNPDEIDLGEEELDVPVPETVVINKDLSLKSPEPQIEPQDPEEVTPIDEKVTGQTVEIAFSSPAPPTSQAPNPTLEVEEVKIKTEKAQNEFNSPESIVTPGSETTRPGRTPEIIIGGDYNNIDQISSPPRHYHHTHRSHSRGRRYDRHYEQLHPYRRSDSRGFRTYIDRDSAPPPRTGATIPLRRQNLLSYEDKDIATSGVPDFGASLTELPRKLFAPTELQSSEGLKGQSSLEDSIQRTDKGAKMDKDGNTNEEKEKPSSSSERNIATTIMNDEEKGSAVPLVSQNMILPDLVLRSKCVPTSRLSSVQIINIPSTINLKTILSRVRGGKIVSGTITVPNSQSEDTTSSSGVSSDSVSAFITFQSTESAAAYAAFANTHSLSFSNTANNTAQATSPGREKDERDAPKFSLAPEQAETIKEQEFLTAQASRILRVPNLPSNITRPQIREYLTSTAPISSPSSLIPGTTPPSTTPPSTPTSAPNKSTTTNINQIKGLINFVKQSAHPTLLILVFNSIASASVAKSQLETWKLFEETKTEVFWGRDPCEGDVKELLPLINARLKHKADTKHTPGRLSPVLEEEMHEDGITPKGGVQGQLLSVSPSSLLFNMRGYGEGDPSHRLHISSLEAQFEQIKADLRDEELVWQNHSYDSREKGKGKEIVVKGIMSATGSSASSFSWADEMNELAE